MEKHFFFLVTDYTLSLLRGGFCLSRSVRDQRFYHPQKISNSLWMFGEDKKAFREGE